MSIEERLERLTTRGTIVVSGSLLLVVLLVLLALAMTGHDLGPLGGGSGVEITSSQWFGPEGPIGSPKTGKVTRFTVPPNWPLFGVIAGSIVLLTTALYFWSGASSSGASDSS